MKSSTNFKRLSENAEKILQASKAQILFGATSLHRSEFDSFNAFSLKLSHLLILDILVWSRFILAVIKKAFLLT